LEKTRGVRRNNVDGLKVRGEAASRTPGLKANITTALKDPKQSPKDRQGCGWGNCQQEPITGRNLEGKVKQKA